ncbi:MAG: ribonuclease III domain-containing protein [Clostridiaceae bacterium]
MEPDKIRQLNPLNLAFIGDAVFEVFIRERVFEEYMNSSIVVLHRNSVKYVRAESQSFVMGRIEEMLDETEDSFYKRGRNMKSGHAPKNASIADYRRATGFECLLGYLHLSGQIDRLNEIMEYAAEIIEKELISDETGK